MPNHPTSDSLQYLKNNSSDQSVVPAIPREGIMGKAENGNWYNVSVNPDGSFGNYYQQYTEDISETVSYIGLSLPGTSDDEYGWQIRKEFVDGIIIKTLYADNESTFNKIWDNRLTYDYALTTATYYMLDTAGNTLTDTAGNIIISKG